MKKRIRILYIVSVIGLAISSTGLMAEGRKPVVGKPVVLEGDILTVEAKRFRLYGIDAPEKGQMCKGSKRLHDCGHIAATGLMDLTAGVKSIACEPLGPDPEGIMIARCLDPEGFDLSRQMIYTGWAFASPKSSEDFHQLESKSRAAKRGFWKWAVVPPWQWRAERK